MAGTRFRVGTLVVVAFCGALALPAPAGGQAGLVDDPRAVSVALSGPDVLVARTGRHGRVAVDAVPRAGGGVRRVFTLPSPGRDWTAEASLVASPQRLALLVGLENPDGPPESRLYSGPPAGPLALDVRARWSSRRSWVLFDHAVDGDRVLLTEFRRAGLTTRARVLTPGAAPAVVPWPGNVFGHAAIAGDLVAFLGSERRGRDVPIDRVFVADWRTGAVATTVFVGDPDDVRGGPDVDLAADGSVVVADAGRLVTGAPGRSQRAVPHAGRLWAPWFAGAAGIAALRAGRFYSERPVLVDPAGGTARPIGARSTALESLAADERGAAWIANGCVRYAPLDGAQVVAAAPCPAAEVIVEEDEKVLRGRSVRVLVKCVAGAPDRCRGTALLRRRRVLGRGRFDVPAGSRRRVEVRLGRRGMRYVLRRLNRMQDPLLDGAFLDLDARVRDGRVALGYRSRGIAIVRRA
jgi:hypothetical protein